MKKDVRAVSADAMSALMNYRWPGNVRELEHAIERAVILANAASIRLRDLPPEVTQKSRRRPGDDTLDLQDQERASIERALERFRRKSTQGGRGAQHQHRDALAEDEAVRPLVLIPASRECPPAGHCSATHPAPVSVRPAVSR